ncbi:MAG: hypothetical protein JJU29_09070 [Verrucomicrobia bacterium]|nr:hypothetical protein [Verrucomicrobiota bacterium]MCH8511803.1 hypothetical protein [Kiritimatiellia bacterium]
MKIFHPIPFVLCFSVLSLLTVQAQPGPELLDLDLGPDPEIKALQRNRPGRWGQGARDWSQPVEGWEPVEANEHPRLVFRSGDVERLRARAETPEGKVILARMQKLLDGPFTLWHPAAHGLLYQITGNPIHAMDAEKLVEMIIDENRKDKDDRYGFRNPGSGGPMRSGPAIGALGLAYDLNYHGWDPEFRQRVAKAIMDNPFTTSIARRGPHAPSVNHYGAAVGGVGIGLLAIRGDDGVDAEKLEPLIESVFRQVRAEIAEGYGDRGYYFEGHHCGRISSNFGILPFLSAARIAAGVDLVSGYDNARWLAAKWIYEFAVHPDGKFTNAQRGMYGRDFPRGGMLSMNGDFAYGFGVTPEEYLPALKWVYDNQIEPGEKTYDVIEYPHTAIYSLAHWPFDVEAVNPAEQPDLFPNVMRDKGAGYYIFRNGWSGTGDDIVVTALLGTHQNGRGMASGGSVYVIGKGLDWHGQFARYRFPGMFYGSFPIHEELLPDGSGVISAITYTDKVNNFNLDTSVTSTQPTSMAVDFSGRAGVPALVAMVGPMAGYQVEYWMHIKPTEYQEVTGQDGYRTRTTRVKIGGVDGYVMTLQKGDAPEIVQEDQEVRIGERVLRFDGVKLMME